MSNIENLAISSLLLHLFTGLVSFVVPNKSSKIIAAFFSIIIIAINIFVLNFIPAKPISYVIGAFNTVSGIEFTFSKFNQIFMIIISVVTFISMLMAKSNHRIALMSIASFGFCGIILTNDLFNAYVFIEVAALCSYGILHNQDSDQSAFFLMKYLVIATICACIYLLGVGFVYAATGSLNITEITTKISTAPNSMLISGYILIVTAICLKIGIYPMSSIILTAYRSASPSGLFYMMGISSNTYIIFLTKLFILLFKHKMFAEKMFDECLTIYLLLSSVLCAYFALSSKRLITVIINVSFINYAYLCIFALRGDAGIIPTIIIFDLLTKLPVLVLSTKLRGILLNNYSDYIIKDNFTKIIMTIFLLNLIGLPFAIGFYAKFLFIPKFIMFGFIILGTYLFTSFISFKATSKYFFDLFRPHSVGTLITIKYSKTEKLFWVLSLVLCAVSIYITSGIVVG